MKETIYKLNHENKKLLKEYKLLSALFSLAYPIVNLLAVQYARDDKAGWRRLDSKHMAKY